MMADPRLIDWRERAAQLAILFDVHHSKWSAEEARRLEEFVAVVQQDRAITPALRRLIIAARVVAYGGLFDSLDPEKRSAMRELEQASEAYAAAVPWEDEPDA
jgi:hypothetical protein